MQNRAQVPRLLCIDDQPELLIMLEHFLSSQGFSIVAASSGTEAMECIRDGRFDAVVLDYEMPVMNGEEVARRLKQLYADQPIVLFSAAGSDVPETVKPLVDAIVRKGNSLTDLTDALRRLLPNPLERRQNPRRTVDLQAEVVHRSDFNAKRRTKLADLSSGGIGVAEQLDVAVGQLVELQIAFAGQAVLFRATAIVRYQQAGRTGLAFVEMDEQQRRFLDGYCGESASASNASS